MKTSHASFRAFGRIILVEVYIWICDFGLLEIKNLRGSYPKGIRNSNVSVVLRNVKIIRQLYCLTGKCWSVVQGLGQASLCRLGQRQSVRLALVPYCHLAGVPYCHHARVPYCHLALVPYCHHVVVPYCHHAVMPYCHLARVPYCQMLKCNLPSLPECKPD